MTAWVSPWFMLLHIHSSEFLCPNSQNAKNPVVGDELVVGSQTTGAKFRFKQVIGHWGHFEHESGLIWYTKNDALEPNVHDTIHLGNSNCTDACLFTIDQPLMWIRHKSGYALYPKDEMPQLVRIDRNASEGHELKFSFRKPDFTDIYDTVEDFFPTMHAFGEWMHLRTILKPRRSFKLKITYVCGRKVSLRESQELGWVLTTSDVLAVMIDSALFPRRLSKTNSCTWSYTKSNHMTPINVVAGETIVVWQWKYKLHQFNEHHEFFSNVIETTTDPENKPSQFDPDVPCPRFNNVLSE